MQSSLKEHALCCIIMLINLRLAVGEPAPIATFNQHTDYVNCLAAAKATPRVASAGLRAEVFLWDIQKAMRINEQVTAQWLL